MKILATLVGALMLVVTLYGAGFVTAISFLHAEPVATWKPGRDTARAWTLEPVRVEDDETDLQRLPARISAPTRNLAEHEPGDAPGGAGANGTALTIDTMTTAALTPDEEAEPDADVETGFALPAEHVRWCEARYRSYRVEDDSYRPYSGGTRRCISPYSDALAQSEAGGSGFAVADAGGFEDVAYAETVRDAGRPRALTIEHVRACASRYRSYRVSDNSYQPYGGGPRRLCE